MLEAQLGEVRNPLIGNLQVGGHREDIDLAAREGRLGLVLVVGQVPVLNHPRAADPLRADELVPLDAGRLHQLLDPRRDEHVEAVAGVEDAQAGGRSFGVVGEPGAATNAVRPRSDK